MRRRAVSVVGVLLIGLVVAACGSGGSPAAVPTTATSRTTAPNGSSATIATSSTPTCPTMAQADAALGVSDAGPNQSPAGGGGIVCEYTGAAGVGDSDVTIFAYLSAATFTGQVAHLGTVPGMQGISGIGDGAYALSTAGRSVVNAYARGSRTVVAAQTPGTLAAVEALARIALAEN